MKPNGNHRNRSIDHHASSHTRLVYAASNHPTNTTIPCRVPLPSKSVETVHEIMSMPCEQKSTRKSPEIEEGRGEARDKCRKLWKTLDPMVVDRSDNLYTAVRQSLHKVSRNTFSTLKSNAETKNRSGVSQESSIGRFSTIKAFFDKDDCQEEKGARFRCKITVMGRLMRKLELRKREQFPDQVTSMGYFILFILSFLVLLVVSSIVWYVIHIDAWRREFFRLGFIIVSRYIVVNWIILIMLYGINMIVS